VRRADNLTTFMCRLEIREPERPGTPGPAQACNGTALPLPLPLRNRVLTSVLETAEVLSWTECCELFIDRTRDEQYIKKTDIILTG
jgi:hypothetical protein